MPIMFSYIGITMKTKKKHKKYNLKPLSFYPLKPEKVLAAFMKVNKADYKDKNALSSA